MNLGQNLGQYAVKQDLATRFWSKVLRGPSCWIWTGHKSDAGYGIITVNNKNVRAHRLAWELTFFVIPEGLDLDVCHACDVPACVNPSHLMLATGTANNIDKVRKGRQSRGEKRITIPRGESHGRAKLTAANVAIIRELHKGGEPYSRLASRFNVSKSSIADIVNGRNWAERKFDVQVSE